MYSRDYNIGLSNLVTIHVLFFFSDLSIERDENVKDVSMNEANEMAAIVQKLICDGAYPKMFYDHQISKWQFGGRENSMTITPTNETMHFPPVWKHAIAMTVLRK